MLHCWRRTSLCRAIPDLAKSVALKGNSDPANAVLGSVVPSSQSLRQSNMGIKPRKSVALSPIITRGQELWRDTTIQSSRFAAELAPIVKSKINDDQPSSRKLLFQARACFSIARYNKH